MCGIFAAMTRQGVPAPRLQKALASLYHRGPDGHGLWVSEDGRFTLGHTRLSIIGLDNGEQPLANQERNLHLVVNGEFYGYKQIRARLRDAGHTFATDSDSEIALHLYQHQGMQAMSDLRGEFAAILADQREGIMIAIRDRFGIKPLYYAVHDGEVFFASEIKALLALGVPARWDLRSTVGGMARHNERTEFAGIRTVPPGCYAVASGGEVRIYTYWDWEMPTAQQLAEDPRTEAEVVEDFRAALTEAVQERLVADVEVASYLSGGIDSCAVLGLAQQSLDRPIRAFTLSFDNPLFDEAELARKQAEFVGASYHPIPITGRDIADAYSDAIWHSETPMFNGHGVAKFLLSRAVRDAGIKVVFTGEGADEMLGGYPFFRVDALQNDPALNQAQKDALIDEILGKNEASRAIMLPEKVLNAESEAIQHRLGWSPATINSMLAMSNGMRAFLTDDAATELGSHSPVVAALDRMPVGLRLQGRNHLNQSLYISAKTTLANFILVYLGDRMEMAHSIEGRVPFLDHHLAEVAAGLPINMKIKGIREKHVLREAAKEVLIPEVYDRQKHPFTSPPARDANDPMLTFYRDTFSSRAATEQPIYDMAKVNAAVDALLDGPADQRIAIEGGVQRVAGAVLMHEKFGMS